MTPAGAALENGHLSPEEKKQLLPSLTTRAQLLEIECMNLQAARLWAMKEKTLSSGDLVTEKFCRELHRRMFKGIWRGAGRYRTHEVFPGWEPSRISEGVRLFMEDADAWLRYATYPAHESAVRLHHRLMSIRPWTNGNGRHARLLADILVASQGEAPLTWGSRSTGSTSARERYHAALSAADGGTMGELLDFARG
jgi:Fic-DOC domain mobile mystery protein B